MFDRQHKGYPGACVKRILVVDDEILVADTLAIIFRAHGFEVRVAYSAAAGLVCAREFLPQLLICDISMPARNGLELMRDVCAELPDCRMIVLTAQPAHDAAVSEQSRRMSHTARFLTKPCHPRELLREAGAVLASA
jgi:DNA-binding response OmpR family regulator